MHSTLFIPFIVLTFFVEQIANRHTSSEEKSFLSHDLIPNRHRIKHFDGSDNPGSFNVEILPFPISFSSNTTDIQKPGENGVQATDDSQVKNASTDSNSSTTGNSTNGTSTNETKGNETSEATENLEEASEQSGMSINPNKYIYK